MAFKTISDAVCIYKTRNSLNKHSASLMRDRVILSLSLIVATVSIGTAQAMVIPVGSSLQGEGRLNFNGVTVITQQTDSQTFTINALSIADTHTATNALASTVASATWLNANQGNVNFSEVDLLIGDVTVDTYGQNSGLFEYEFKADADGLLVIDYDITMRALGSVSSFYLDSALFKIELFENGYNFQSNLIANNTAGQQTASIIEGKVYKMAFRRDFVGSGESGGFSRLIIDMQQTANFDWQVVPVSAVPVPAAAWLFGSGLIGLLGFARRKKQQ